MSSLPIMNQFLLSVLSVSPGSDSADMLVLRQLAPECVHTRKIALESEHCKYLFFPLFIIGNQPNLSDTHFHQNI